MKTLTYLFVALFASIASFATAGTDAGAKRIAVMLIVEGDDDDEKTVTTIFTTLVAADKVAKMLNAELIADETVEDDVFVFSLKSQEQHNLAMKIFDEEGYEMANNLTNFVEGANYRAVNVENLPDGTYNLKLTNGDAELNKSFTVSRGKVSK